jgi:hypothetical protein
MAVAVTTNASLTTYHFCLKEKKIKKKKVGKGTALRKMC